MEIIPSAVVTRFEKLEPGDLFLYMQGEHKFYASKTQQPPAGDRSTMVTLGPSLLLNSAESFLLPWQAVTVLSLGKNFSILLPTEVSAWSAMGPNRMPFVLRWQKRPRSYVQMADLGRTNTFHVLSMSKLARSGRAGSKAPQSLQIAGKLQS
jgi:hypothetical protein